MKINSLVLLKKVLVTVVWLGGSSVASASPKLYFYSEAAVERVVRFDHEYITEARDLATIEKWTAADRQYYLSDEIRPALKFIYGPLTRRVIAGPQADEFIEVDWDHAFMRDGRAVLPLHYRAHWLIEKEFASVGQVQIPIPLNYEALYTDNWKKCTDSDPEHQTRSFYWYFWDPTRWGCDHKLGDQYAEVTVTFGLSTSVQTLSFPEYDRMLGSKNGDADLALTIAFGYVEDSVNPKPETDFDYGAREYRDFVKLMTKSYPYLESRPISLGEYPGFRGHKQTIGYEFTGHKNGIQIRLNVVIAAGIDQMYLFAKSFAHDHDDLFAWMGHSRVGSGFDARNFKSIMERDPQYYSVTDQYQLIYWGGCNSYSYYTLPFFEVKAKAFPLSDPKGTKNLDIVAHGLPSFFSLNVENADVLTAAVMNYEARLSYQEIIQKLERQGETAGATLLAVVLGDEDNLP